MSNFRIMLMSTAAAGLVAAAVSPAFAGEVEKSVSMGGRVNRAVVVTDNGQNTTLSQIDPTAVSGSRFSINGSAKSESMTIGAHTELGLQANPSTGSHTQGAASSLNIRHSYVDIKNSMGTLAVGHTWSADALTLSNSLSGTGNAGFYDGHINSGEEIHVTNDTSTASSGVTVGGVANIHGGGRESTIKYSTPNFSGFSANLGYGHNNGAAAQVTYAADFDGVMLQAQASFGQRDSSTSVDSETSASLAVSLAGGFYGSVAYSKQNLQSNQTRHDPDFLGASIGFKSGATGITLWGSQQQDAAANGDQADSIGVSVEHQLSDYGTSIYGGISNVGYDTASVTTNYDDLTSGWVGIRVNF
jgi:hypothetical protein